MQNGGSAFGVSYGVRFWCTFEACSKHGFSDILFVSAVHLFTPKSIPLNPGQPCYNLLISYRARAAASISASVLKEEKLKRTIPCFSV